MTGRLWASRSGEASTWMAAAPGGSGEPGAYQTSSKNGPPTSSTTSASSSARRMATASKGRPSRKFGWLLGTTWCARMPSHQTAAPSSEESATRSATALAASSPATMTGRRPPSRSAAAASMPAGSGSVARWSWPGDRGPSSVSCSSTSIGRATNTGPAGGSVAIFSARCMIGANSSARSTCTLHLVSGAAIATRSCPSTGPRNRRRVSCCPAVTTSGARALKAL